MENVLEFSKKMTKLNRDKALTYKTHHRQTLANRTKPGPSLQVKKWQC